MLLALGKDDSFSLRYQSLYGHILENGDQALRPHFQKQHGTALSSAASGTRHRNISSTVFLKLKKSELKKNSPVVALKVESYQELPKYIRAYQNNIIQEELEQQFFKVIQYILINYTGKCFSELLSMEASSGLNKEDIQHCYII
ncbi:hypothetical protein BDF21DRAFT_455976 [Thamnidium elegans]|nr:hypothetical protein BDF21DRAFT_455976 [Thamnidium elegans]